MERRRGERREGRKKEERKERRRENFYGSHFPLLSIKALTVATV